MSTLDVVAEILREVAPRALCAKEIAELAGARLPTASKTPQTVVSRDLAIDVKRHGAASRFLRVDRGEFVLKESLPTAFYNDNDSYAATWTRNLAAAGEIAPGVVDERSIRDLKPADVACYRQCHFFAGIGTWSRALLDAGWPDDVPVWSGSCPCSPWSQAGRKKGFDDEQHLWPEWFRLIEACRPPVVLGEQVSSKDGLAWFDALRVDLERAGYSVGVLDTCAAGAGAPHLRQRLYFVAVFREREGEVIRAARELVDAGLARGRWDAGALPRAEGVGEGERVEPGDLADELVAPGAAHDYQPGDRVRPSDPTWGGAVRGFWTRDVEWIYCRPAPGHQDGCFRPIGSDAQSLAHGTSEGMGRTRAKRLRCFGNGIVLPQATAFVSAVIDLLADAARETASAAVVEALPSARVTKIEGAAWTGPCPGETAPSGMLYGRVPGDRWPYGPPSAHESCCNLFPHRGSPGGLFCDCAASAADDVEHGISAWPTAGVGA